MLGQGLDIVLEDERGVEEERLYDQGLLFPLIYQSRTETPTPFRLIDSIDEFGITLFNTLQMKQLSIELKSLRAFAKKKSEQEMVAKLQDMVNRGKAKMYRYLRIIGD